MFFGLKYKTTTGSLLHPKIRNTSCWHWSLLQVLQLFQVWHIGLVNQSNFSNHIRSIPLAFLCSPHRTDPSKSIGNSAMLSMALRCIDNHHSVWKMHHLIASKLTIRVIGTPKAMREKTNFLMRNNKVSEFTASYAGPLRISTKRSRPQTPHVGAKFIPNDSELSYLQNSSKPQCIQL